MNKKTVALMLCVALLASALTAGTLAYFTDKEQKTNTMAVGNISINLEELAWTGTGYVPFDDDLFTLYPITDAKGINLFNKMVYTFNTSKEDQHNSDAYIRTIVLFEHNEDADDCGKTCCAGGIHFAHYGEEVSAGEYSYPMGDYTIHTSKAENKGVMTVDNVKYHVVEFTAKDGKAIPTGEALEAINGVWLDSTLTNEQVEGWGEDGVQIKVFTQGIQADNLTHEEAMAALGEISVANLTDWFDTDDAVINDILPWGKDAE